MTFPKDFLWGSATSSYQIEGDGLNDGRGECIWHRFSHTPGKIKDGSNGDIACDHYHRYKEDVALMQSLGLQVYRFSTSWARVLPTGTGAVNPAGLDFYDRLVDELLAAGIRPFLTLYHWDMPKALQDRGGWGDPASVEWFAEYTRVMTARLGDRVKDWITHNEPFCAAVLGHWMGIHAPGLQDPSLTVKVAHHLLLSHGASMRVIREQVPDARAGITLNFTPAYPATDSDADRLVAQQADAFGHRWYLDPVFNGCYPDDLMPMLQQFGGDFDLSDISKACEPMDFLGVNFYSRNIIRANPDNPMGGEPVPPDGAEVTDFGWEVYPDALRDLLIRLHREYGPKAIYITENGAAYDDLPPTGDVVDDPKRVSYLERHFKACEQAMAAGVPLKGYFVWSLLDNFEWAEGYTKRFGIVYVDFATQKRTPKRSALLVKRMIADAV
jgi:beta-glucosidase